MGLILHIDTSTESASTGLSRHGQIIDLLENPVQKEHASFLHPAISELLKKNKVTPPEIDAIAVANGPGSYTGLRVGLASAKGLCYAWNKPLITVGTLEAMAKSVMEQRKEPLLYCPMIDARRMEVFTAVYQDTMQQVVPEQAMVLEENSFAELLSEYPILFFGSGMSKWRNLCKDPNALFEEHYHTHSGLAILANSKFYDKTFTELAHSEPQYGKAFHDNK